MPTRKNTGGAILFGAAAFLVTGVPAYCGVLMATDRGEAILGETWMRRCLRGLDARSGRPYLEIASRGYSYDPRHASTVAFFPGLPLAARGLSALTALPMEAALPLASNLCGVGAFAAMACYARRRFESERQRAGETPARDPMLAVLALGLAPAAYYFRMGHSESLFLFAAIICMLAIDAGLPPVIVALAVGFGTATRPVGVALLAPLVAYSWRRSATGARFAARLAYVVPLGCWGLAAYMLFQHLEFDDALAFAKTQDNYSLTKAPLVDKVTGLLSWVPVWSIYDVTSPGYWRRNAPYVALINQQFAEPLYFFGTALLACAGWRKRWISGDEALLSAAMLGIPYLTRSFEMSMAGHARFAAVVFPAYFAVERLLLGVGTLGRTALAVACAALMLAYTFYFALDIPRR